MYDEGVIKFSAEHRDEPLSRAIHSDLACRLVAWRQVMSLTRLVGQDPGRYGGAGYGNVSGRVGAPSAARGRRGFLITGTQTGGVKHIGLRHFCLVHSYDYDRNRVVSQGSINPSSESMTHGAIYDLSPSIRFVLHAHTPTIWQARRTLSIPTTGADVPYGTPDMAYAVQRLYRDTALPDVRILAMAGHEDGVIVFGRTAEEAGQVLINYLARAFELDCQCLDVGVF